MKINLGNSKNYKSKMKIKIIKNYKTKIVIITMMKIIIGQHKKIINTINKKSQKD